MGLKKQNNIPKINTYKWDEMKFGTIIKIISGDYKHRFLIKTNPKKGVYAVDLLDGSVWDAPIYLDMYEVVENGTQLTVYNG